jgi:hypothetical protein
MHPFLRVFRTMTTSAPPSTGQRIATALLAERRRIAMGFRAAAATSATRAAPLKTLGLRHDAPFEDLIKLGVIQRTDTGFWFDETQYERTIERPRFRVLGMAFVIGIFLLLIVAMVGVFTA